MRLFIATPIPLRGFQELRNELSPYIQGKWSKEENLHLTHKFIGEDDPNNWKIPLSPPKEPINVSSFGIFNNKILYLKASSPNINQIATLLGVKNFVPHVTLCRMKHYDSALLEKLQTIQISQSFAFTLYLYQSILTPKGPIYKKIWQY